MKDALLVIGTLAGLGISGLGLVMLVNRPDPSTTYAGERPFDNIVGDIIGIPCLLIGVPLLVLCAWGLLR